MKVDWQALPALPFVNNVVNNTAKLQTCRWRCASQCFTPYSNRSDNRTFADVLEAAMSRRSFLKGSAVAAGSLMVINPFAQASAQAQEMNAEGRNLRFTPVPTAPADEDALVVPEGYSSNVIIRWGDPLTADGPAFDWHNQSPEAQAVQFGYNCDYVAYMPYPLGSDNPDRALLVVNHEYTNPELMHAGYNPDNPTTAQINTEMMAHGMSVVEILREDDGSWMYVPGPRNYRLTAETPMQLTGPAAGHALLQTNADSTGTEVLGTLNNCAGGWTPWGTVLTGEENFHQYFSNREAVTNEALAALHARYGLPEGNDGRRWADVHDRFDMAKEPNEVNRFGWVIEIDPYDPDFVPRKRTALGRFKHEGAETSLSDDGRVVAYMGDDERFDYMYKFVSAERYLEDDRNHNLTLLDSGTLYVARLDDDNTGVWLPLVHGQGPLSAENGFADQAEVLIKTRLAADLLGATKMDRPEDVERNPVTGAVYAAMTNNTNREADQIDAANPRAANRYGHIVELREEGNDAAATSFAWDIFLLCGDPNDPEAEAYFAGFDMSQVSPIAAPDNVAFDAEGNLWIATDGQPGILQHNDGFFAVPTEGAERGYLRQFLSVPAGSEACGPSFNADHTTIFVAVQHPGEGGSFEEPVSFWPDYDDGGPRPSVAAVYRADDNELIGA